MSPPKGSSNKRAAAAASDGGALAAATANVEAGTTAASRAPAGLPDAVRDQHTHVTSGPDLNYNVSSKMEKEKRGKGEKGEESDASIASDDDGGGGLIFETLFSLARFLTQTPPPAPPSPTETPKPKKNFRTGRHHLRRGGLHVPGRRQRLVPGRVQEEPRGEDHRRALCRRVRRRCCCRCCCCQSESRSGGFLALRSLSPCSPSSSSSRGIIRPGLPDL